MTSLLHLSFALSVRSLLPILGMNQPNPPAPVHIEHVNEVEPPVPIAQGDVPGDNPAVFGLNQNMVLPGSPVGQQLNGVPLPLPPTLEQVQQVPLLRSLYGYPRVVNTGDQ
ncbi:unnamed protein product [Rhizoctonia solani]|uniref:Uncharacterized protein n=1 Tax=Rhizoctonia solani TaxID=456999 RepID=A0A8H2ZY95_9AGAM|nr:unnamed protein product [Rhizoctonia solani]